MNYDLPTRQIEARDGNNVTRRPDNKGKTLRFLCYWLGTAALTVGLLTYLRFMGLLTPIIEAITAKLLA